MGPGQVTVETDVDQGQTWQGRAHDIQLSGHGKLHLVKTHAACPGEVRVSQQHAMTTGRSLAPHRHRIAATLQSKIVLPCLRHTHVHVQARDGIGRGSARQGFGKLSYPTFNQQTPGELDQIKRGNRSQPLRLQALRTLPLSHALGQRAVVALGIAFEQGPHLRRLCLPEAEYCRGRV
ncbi:hypothetical protein D3C79_694240 [compost metagenome]